MAERFRCSPAACAYSLRLHSAQIWYERTRLGLGRSRDDCQIGPPFEAAILPLSFPHRGALPTPPPRPRTHRALGDVRVLHYFLFTYSSCRIKTSLIFDWRRVCPRRRPQGRRRGAGVVFRRRAAGWRAMWCEKLVAGAGMSLRARRSLRGAERGANSVPRPVI